MKKIAIIFSIVLTFSIFTTVFAKDNVNSNIEIPESSVCYTDVDTLIEYLNNSELDLEFYCFDKMTDYYDEFISLYVDETAYIGGIADNG